MSDLYRKRVLAAKIETTPGTAIAVSGTDAAMNVFNLVANPTAASEQRMGQGAFGQLASVVGLQTGQFTFQTEIYGSSGAAPSWLQTLFAGCGVSYSAGVFSPKSEMPGSNVKTLTLGAYTNGVYKQIAGAMGNVTLTVPAGGRVMLNWTFQGRWTTPTDVTIVAPTYPTPLPTMAKSVTTITVGSWTPRITNLTFDLGNVVVPRPGINSSGGLHSYLVTDRFPTGTLDPESTLVATNPVYSHWQASTEQVFELTLESSTGDTTISLDIPKFQVSNAQEGDRSGIQFDTVTYQANRGNTGNDEFTLTFAAV
jgi:hypothetical protein